MACCKGKEIQPQIVSPQWQQNLMGQTAGMVGQGLQQGATPLPPELQQMMMGGAQANPLAMMAMNLMSQNYFGQPYQQPQGGMFPWMGQQMPQGGGGMPPMPGGGMGMPQGGGMPAFNFGAPSPMGGGMQPGFDPYATRPQMQ